MSSPWDKGWQGGRWNFAMTRWFLARLADGAAQRTRKDLMKRFLASVVAIPFPEYFRVMRSQDEGLIRERIGRVLPPDVFAVVFPGFTKSRRRSGRLSVRSSVVVPAVLLGWERELLLPLVADLLDTMRAEIDSGDEGDDGAEEG